MKQKLLLCISFEIVPLEYAYLKATLILQETYSKGGFPSLLGLLEKYIEDYDTYNGPQRAENLHLPDLDLFRDIRVMSNNAGGKEPSREVEKWLCS